ncbi:MAG: 23S rRNA (pseudouridine(1915)-N(3))-methyltransferase RlmH [Planctomycetota bacterium]
MRVLILAIGKARRGPEAELYRQFAERVSWPLELRELDEKRPLPPAERIARESELLLAAVPAGASIVALDRRGQNLSSIELARWLGRARERSVSVLAFLIGGAEGLSERALQAAQLTLAFGNATWPHFLVRAMLCEQIYRAEKILAGHPYHRQ